MLFPFPFRLVAQIYSHSHGNPMGMGIPIPMHTSILLARLRWTSKDLFMRDRIDPTGRGSLAANGRRWSEESARTAAMTAQTSDKLKRNDRLIGLVYVTNLLSIILSATAVMIDREAGQRPKAVGVLWEGATSPLPANCESAVCCQACLRLWTQTDPT